MEDEDYIVMLLNADLTIYRSEIHDLLLSHSNIVYTQQYFGTVLGFSVDDILFMDESSVHINCGVRKYAQLKKDTEQLTFLNTELDVITLFT